MRHFSIFLIGVVILAGALGSNLQAQQPQYGGTVVRSEWGDATTLNPAWKYDSSAYRISQNIYSTLVISDNGVSVGQGPYGDLAKSWEVSNDGLTYTFHLHDNVYWHDGVKFSSADVKFTYDLAKEKKYPIAKYLNLVSEILTPDENTVVFKLSKVNSAFLPMLANASNWYGQIIAKHLYEGTDIPKNPYNKKPVGTGPFVFVEWQQGQFVSMKANEKYFRGRPYLDKVVWLQYTNKEVAQADFKSGKSNLLTYQLVPQYHEIKPMADQKGVKLWRQSGIYSHCVRFNFTRKPFDDIRVREAISLAIDRQEINQLAFAEYMRPLYYASSFGTPSWTNQKARWPEQNQERAKKLLDDAGYPAGTNGVRMQLTTAATEYYKDLTDVIIQQLKRIGVEVKLDMVDTATWFSRLRSADFDLIAYYDRYGPDPDAYREHFGTGQTRNYGKYSNSEADKLLQEGIRIFNQAERKKIYDKVQEILLKDFAVLPLAELGYLELSTDKLHGVPMGDPAAFGKSLGWSGCYAMWLEK